MLIFLIKCAPVCSIGRSDTQTSGPSCLLAPSFLFHPGVVVAYTFVNTNTIVALPTVFARCSRTSTNTVVHAVSAHECSPTFVRTRTQPCYSFYSVAIAILVHHPSRTCFTHRDTVIPVASRIRARTVVGTLDVFASSRACAHVTGMGMEGRKFPLVPVNLTPSVLTRVRCAQVYPSAETISILGGYKIGGLPEANPNTDI